MDSSLDSEYVLMVVSNSYSFYLNVEYYLQMELKNDQVYMLIATCVWASAADSEYVLVSCIYASYLPAAGR